MGNLTDDEAYERDEAAEDAHIRYSNALRDVHYKYYPVGGEPLKGSRAGYLKAWGRETKKYFKEMKALGFKNYEWKD